MAQVTSPDCQCHRRVTRRGFGRGDAGRPERTSPEPRLRLRRGRRSALRKRRPVRQPEAPAERLSKPMTARIPPPDDRDCDPSPALAAEAKCQTRPTGGHRPVHCSPPRQADFRWPKARMGTESRQRPGSRQPRAARFGGTLQGCEATATRRKALPASARKPGTGARKQGPSPR